MRETSLLQHVYGHNADLPASVQIPPGDDMAALQLATPTVLVGVDQLADGVHVDLAHTSIERVGWKAVLRSLSDVAAMAARPTGMLVTAMLPRSVGERAARTLIDAIRRTGGTVGCPLVGGDVGVWEGPFHLTVTTLAEPAGIAPVRRDGARVGDRVFVTGQLGGSWTGPPGGSAPHLEVEPRVAHARALAKAAEAGLHSMIDLSDGLGRDLGHVCDRSGVVVEVEVARLPIRPEAEAAARRSGRPPREHALSDGEDYELCFTVDPSVADRLPASVHDVALTEVGRIIRAADPADESRVRLRLEDGRTVSAAAGGWEHAG